MEGDAGTSRLNPTPSAEGDEQESEESESATFESEKPESEKPEPEPFESGATAAETDRSDEDTVAETASASRLSSRRWVVAACVTLVLLSAALVAGGVVAMFANDRAAERRAAEDAAVAAAKDCVMATQAPDAEAIAASQRRIIECSTGDFAAQAQLYSGVLVDAYAAANAKVEVSNIRAAAERHNDDGTIDVLVALRVKVTNATVQDQESGYRLRVQMAPADGTYKIAGLDQVTR
jgi:Mce-associated membrane protein